MKLDIQFRAVNEDDIPTIFAWLAQPAVQAFWDNTEAHRQDIIAFAQGRQKPSSYFNGEFVYWLGVIQGEPFCLVMTMLERPSCARPAIKQQCLSTTGTTYSVDFMIGHSGYRGKGLAAPTLASFLRFFKAKVDQKATTFWVDPGAENGRARRVYEKAGFEYVGDFTMEQGCYSGQVTQLLVKQL